MRWLGFVSYLQEGEVAVLVDVGDLQISHDHFAVLKELLQGAVLLVQVRQGAQLVLRAGANCRRRQRKQVLLCLILGVF